MVTVKHEKWPISSFGMSVSESVTMIIARDARAYMNSSTHMRSGDVITYIYVNQIESHTDNFKIFPEWKLL